MWVYRNGRVKELVRYIRGSAKHNYCVDAIRDRCVVATGVEEHTTLLNLYTNTGKHLNHIYLPADSTNHMHNHISCMSLSIVLVSGIFDTITIVGILRQRLSVIDTIRLNVVARCYSEDVINDVVIVNDDMCAVVLTDAYVVSVCLNVR